MRALKFRIWNNGHNEFIRPDYGLIGFCYPLDGRIAVLTSNSDIIEDCVIEQYTGLKDKNGKEIYVGDIVSVRNKNRKNEYNIGVVEFGKAAFRCPFLLGKYHSGQIEVIGNVHENADLLEEDNVKKG